MYKTTHEDLKNHSHTFYKKLKQCNQIGIRILNTNNKTYTEEFI